MNAFIYPNSSFTLFLTFFQPENIFWFFIRFLEYLVFLIFHLNKLEAETLRLAFPMDICFLSKICQKSFLTILG